jgi:hypothetical protein
MRKCLRQAYLTRLTRAPKRHRTAHDHPRSTAKDKATLASFSSTFRTYQYRSPVDIMTDSIKTTPRPTAWTDPSTLVQIRQARDRIQLDQSAQTVSIVNVSLIHVYPFAGISASDRPARLFDDSGAIPDVDRRATTSRKHRIIDRRTATWITRCRKSSLYPSISR